jgi:hypothetical protein
MHRVVLSLAEYYIGASFLFPKNQWAGPKQKERIGNSTASAKVSHLKSIITSTIFNLSALTENSPLLLDPKLNPKSAR